MKDFKPSEIEEKWQQKWEADYIYSPDVNSAKKPFFNLMMFPYPSAEGLHVGNMYAFTGADVYGRFQRMNGHDVLEPIGLDGFGIHSENYAMKVGRHPKEQAQIAEQNFYRQLRSIGNSFDWSRTVETYDPEYYKWTQWLFIQLFKKGLAYRNSALVNWCPKDLTVLSDEQVIDGKCERCGSEVEKKNLEQWFFRITNYAERLLNNIEGLKWTNKVKIAQRNWIGKSEGAEIRFQITDDRNHKSENGNQLVVFTTRPDTLYGATFMVIAPEHSLAQSIEASEVKSYVEQARNKTEIERTTEGREKTGVFSGLYAINPVNNEKIPVWIADYVLAGYGTGAIMAVPAHDQRDFEFAKKYNLPITQVIQGEESVAELSEAYTGAGRLINSGEWDGIEVPKEMGKVLASLEVRTIGSRKANYHLRDWLISRQRYWGPPIPMIFCSTCQKNGKSEVEGMDGWFSVPEAELPVRLPDVEDWKPMGTGKSPLANHPEFYKTTCPNCGSEATRETDVSDTFLDSSWYFLRYPSTDIENKPFDTDRTSKWLPVTQYTGGAEHSVLHLLYSRFVTMALKDMGFVNFEEPFANFFAHGLIIKDGAKMSKSKGNVVVPDEYIKKYGADTLRSYLMFIGPYSDGGDFRDSGIEGMFRFLRKVWNLMQKEAEGEISPEAKRFMHRTIQRVTKDVSEFSYNTAIAGLMEWYNFLIKQTAISKEEKETYLKLLAPFAPHMTEEIWQQLSVTASEAWQSSEIASSQIPRNDNSFNSIHLAPWPQYDEKYLVSDTAIIIVQVNGKKRGELEVSRSEAQDQAGIEAKAKEIAVKYLEGVEVKKVIYIPGKILNIVVK